jgi:hypothetical protein
MLIRGIDLLNLQLELDALALHGSKQLIDIFGVLCVVVCHLSVMGLLHVCGLIEHACDGHDHLVLFVS